MSYIDGFVIAVPTANKQKFIEHARQLDPIFIELGAIRVIEGWGDEAAFLATAKAELAPGKLDAIGGQGPYSLGLYRHQITRTKTAWSAG